MLGVVQWGQRVYQQFWFALDRKYDTSTPPLARSGWTRIKMTENTEKETL